MNTYFLIKKEMLINNFSINFYFRMFIKKIFSVLNIKFTQMFLERWKLVVYNS